MGRLLHEQLASLRTAPSIGDIRGRGLLAGIELVADRNTRRPFPRSAQMAERFAAAALELGLVVWPNAGQLEDGTGDLIMLAPPFVITESQIGEMVELLTRAAEQVAPASEAGR
jgi:adenosylmethionine-8-amino-7-oxononanoate aminotransferase